MTSADDCRPDPSRTRAKLENYKCFASPAQGFESLLPISVIVGRNNSGKSSLLDAVGFLCGEGSPIGFGHKGHPDPRLCLSAKITNPAVDRVFALNTQDNVIGDHGQFRAKVYGHLFHWKVSNNKSQNEFLGVEAGNLSERIGRYGHGLVAQMESPLNGRRFVRLSAERDMRPEPDAGNGDAPSIDPTGVGATALYQQVLTASWRNPAVVRETICGELNAIFADDGSFSDIGARKHPNNSWEVYVTESNKGAIPLSMGGSGLKTIMLVLALIHLVPHIEGRKLADYAFALEELENNLHPALQRRLLLYLSATVRQHGCMLFLTTHSPIAIDLFARNQDAQIIHVTHDGTSSVARTVSTYVDSCGILDDLDVRASDLLQSNGIVWVEGPSDRLYVNRWIDLWSGGELKEGTHYQCMFYGGRLLAHLDAAVPEEERRRAVQVLRINRNAAIIIDSDRNSADDAINATKERIVAEMNDLGGMAWVTTGREIENYLPQDVVREVGETRALVTQYDALEYSLNAARAGAGDRFVRDKLAFAERASATLTRENSEGSLDLSARMTELCTRIRRWNRLPDA